MDTITVNISRTELLDDMKVTSHAEVAAIADAKVRYLAELGSEKEQLAQQAITDTSVEVLSVLRRYIDGTSGDGAASNDYDASDISYTLSVSSRKSAGLAEPLTKAVHDYMRESALAKYYDSVSQVEMAQRHRARIVTPLATMHSLLYRKDEPQYNGT